MIRECSSYYKIYNTNVLCNVYEWLVVSLVASVGCEALGTRRWSI